MAYNWQGGGNPSNLEMLSHGYSTRGIDEFSGRDAFGGHSLPGKTNLGMTQQQTIDAKLTHAEEARKNAVKLDTEVTKKVKEIGDNNQLMKDLYAGAQMTASLAEMMTAKRRDFDRKTKKFLGSALNNPLTQRGLKSGLEYILGGTGEEAAGEKAGELAKITADEFAGEAAEATGEEVAEVATQEAAKTAAEVGADVAVEAGAEAAGEAVSEAAAESASLASEIAGPVVSGITKMGAGMLSGKGVGRAAAGAAAGVGASAAVATIPAVGPFLAPFAGAAASFGADQALGGGKGGGGGGMGMRSGVARKHIGLPSAVQLMKGYG